MRHCLSLATLFALALLLASCAGPARLARQSDAALAHGDLRKAYDRALRAIEKDPQNAEARAAYDAASRRVALDYRQRVLALAAADTVGAAELALTFRQFRGEVANHQSALGEAPEYEAGEARILAAAARRFYRLGRQELAAHQPRAAWRDFSTCRRFDDGFADVLKQQENAYTQAHTVVAFLPLADGVGVPGLAQAVERRVIAEIGRRERSSFQFTHLVDADAVDAQVTVAQLRELPREEALRIGRTLGAQRVITGHIAGLRSSTDTQDLTVPVFRPVEEKDADGKPVTRWDESLLRVIVRERDVTVHYDFDVIDVRTGEVLAHRQQPAQTRARTVWTDFQPGDDYRAYRFAPASEGPAGQDRAKKSEAQWKARVGEWSLGEMMQHAHEDRSRARYAPRFRGEFLSDTQRRPVWLGELPGEDELAFVALNDAWNDVFDALRELDGRD